MAHYILFVEVVARFMKQHRVNCVVIVLALNNASLKENLDVPIKRGESKSPTTNHFKYRPIINRSACINGGIGA
jgi:hypothetical protein